MRELGETTRLKIQPRQIRTLISNSNAQKIQYKGKYQNRNKKDSPKSEYPYSRG
jgi:hypothetical protein